MMSEERSNCSRRRLPAPAELCWLVVLITAFGWFSSLDLRAQATGLYRELFNGFERVNSSLWHLTNDVRFLNNQPSSTSVLSSFRAEQNRDEDYGQRVRGFVLPPTTGGYTFW